MKNKIIVGFLFILIASLMLSCGAKIAHGEVTERRVGLGAVVETGNPNTSVVGSLISGEVVTDRDGREATALRIHPRSVYAFYDEGLIFCGDQTARLSSKDGRLIQGDLAFTYRRQAARMIDGMPCFELKAIDQVTRRIQ